MSYVSPNMNKPIVSKEGDALDQLRKWILAVTRTQLFSGSGSPEGVIEAISNAQYVDIDTDILYYKRDSDIDGDTAMGWRQVV